MNFADQEEIAERQQRRRRRQRRDATWNAFSGIVIAAAVVAAALLVWVFIDPSAPLNPFPPPTMPVLAVAPATTPTLYVLPATWTPTSAPSSTPAPTATHTPLPTLPATPTKATVVITADPNAQYPFVLKSNPVPMSNLIFHPEGNCNWQGVAGQVVDLQGRAVVGLSVHLSGTYAGKTVDMTTLTGAAQAWYGESGFEFVLGQTPIASSGELSIQLADQGMLAVSDQVAFDTFAACEKNLVLVNFRQVR